MLSLRSSRPLLSLASRAYATAAAGNPPPPPFPPTATTYDPEQDPQLFAMGYPQLSTQSRQLRSPKGWWDTQERIEFGEAVPENDDIQSMWAPDVHKVKPISALSQLLFAFSMVGLFAGGVYMIKAAPPALPRAYPYEGLKSELGGDEANAARPTSANEIEE